MNYTIPSDQISGFNAPGHRFRFLCRPLFRHPIWLPSIMKKCPEIVKIIKGISPLQVFNTTSIKQARNLFNLLRIDYDFSFWAYYVCRVPEIGNHRHLVPLILNDCQRKVIDTIQCRMENQKHGRYIITKQSRRIGLTTVIQSFIFWSQTRGGVFGNSYTSTSSSNLSNILKSNFQRNLFTQKRILSTKKPLSDADLNKIHLNSFANTCDKIRIHPRYYINAHFGPITNIHNPRSFHLCYVHFPNMSFYFDKSGNISSATYRAAAGSVALSSECLLILEGNESSPLNHFFRKEIRAAYDRRSLFFPIRL